MTTKPAPAVRPAAAGTLEAIAYDSVAGLPAAEPHDLDRLGYSLWLWLKHRRDPLETAFRSARARLLIGEREALDTVRARLRAAGVSLE